MAKDCFCRTCDKWFSSLGISRHRAMHRDRNEDCTIVYTAGNIKVHRFSLNDSASIRHMQEGIDTLRAENEKLREKVELYKGKVEEATREWTEERSRIYDRIEQLMADRDKLMMILG